MNTFTLLRRPSAFVPLVMSAAALALVIGHVALYGVQRQADEGAAAHVFQLLVVFQLPVMVAFAFGWLQRSPRQALLVLALQAGAVFAAVALVIWLER